MDEDDDEVYNFVMSFLFDFFEGKPFPAFEKEKLKDVYDMVSLIISKEEIGKKQLEDNLKRTTEYQMECQRIGRLLRGVGLNSQNLSVGGQASLRNLAMLSHSLNCDASLSSMYEGVLEMQSERESVKSQGEALRREQQSLQDQTLKLNRELVELKERVKRGREAQIAREMEVERQKGSVPYMMKKKGEYDLNRSNYAAQLDAVGYTRALNHSVLVERFNEIEALKKEMEPLLKDLEKFGDLDPHIGKAQERLEAARGSLTKLKVKYNELLNSISLPDDK